jgi:hypothetical protein
VRLWDAATGWPVLLALEGPEGKQAGSDNQILPRTITVSNEWVMEGNLNILWLPSEYRTTIKAISGELVALGQNSGRISLFKFTKASKVL